MRTNLDASRHK